MENSRLVAMARLREEGLSTQAGQLQARSLVTTPPLPSYHPCRWASSRRALTMRRHTSRSLPPRCLRRTLATLTLAANPNPDLHRNPNPNPTLTLTVPMPQATKPLLRQIVALQAQQQQMQTAWRESEAGLQARLAPAAIVGR